ncbi:VWA domain-containing protein [Granulicella sibirica]|uniref:VWFA-related domain-containing protein n=1 Tax=Granulicella sibirica TaxID=2479048 RepID=A0A4Q0T506_9BACT|nr:VWA domain-containing protein [Granulicella sibirica]RXH58825.1 hypothetical protein GRAN_2135 [Granulicella sibirica]
MKDRILRRLLFASLIATPSLLLVAQQPATTDPQPPPSQSTPAPSPPAPPAAAAPPPRQAGAPGQPLQPNPDGTYTIRRNARLVFLDVVVTDAKNNVVRDLTKSDFKVTEANEPQEILNFQETGSHLPDPNAVINSTQDLDRLAPNAPVNIVLLDEFNTRFEDMAFARYSLKKYLEKQPDKLLTPTMLVAVDIQKFTVLTDYTQDKQKVLDALDHHFVAYPWQAHNGAWIGERYGIAFGTLMRVAEAVIGHPGHKNMIWIGRGFPPLNFANQPIDTENRVNSIVQQCVNMLRDARVTLYTIDPAGVMVDPGIYGAAAAFNDPFGGNYQFNKLATATGGKALYGRNDVDAEIGTSIRDGSSFYTLTYRPSNTTMDPRKFRRIKIVLDRPGLTATTREGYYLQGGPAPVNPQKPSRRLAFDLVSAGDSTMVYDSVPFTVQPVPNEPDTYFVTVDAKGLVWTYATEGKPRHANLVAMTATFDKKGKELKRDAKTYEVTAPPNVAPTGRIELGTRLKVKIDHDPKAIRARFVVRVSQTGRMGTADLILGQPATAPPVASVPAPAATSTDPVPPPAASNPQP